MKFKTNSKEINKGDYFICQKGNHYNGYNFIYEAHKNGAIKIIGEEKIKYKRVKNVNDYLKKKITRKYKKELKKLKIIGITGTNGKTTTCYLIYELLNFLNKKCAYIGTLGYISKDKEITLNNTTPSIDKLYDLLLNAINDNMEYVVMEISSIALMEERIKGLNLEIAGFTNLTQDHLDYHNNMDNYLKAKLRILDYLKKDKYILLNSDDEHYKAFTKHNYNTYGINGNYKIINYKLDINETIINFSYNNKTYNVTTNLVGLFNIYNYLLALSIVNNLGFTIEEIIDNSKKLVGPIGRCEKIKLNNSFAIIDYAHTPDAVEKIINNYKNLNINKIITIIGCGGNRDKTKRPIMGDIATKLSDHVIFTNDNPRCEKEEDIMNDIIKDLKTDNYEIIYDRKGAIIKGMSLLKDNDILLILGKGHENYQIIGQEKRHFSDKEVVLNNLK